MCLYKCRLKWCFQNFFTILNLLLITLNLHDLQIYLIPFFNFYSLKLLVRFLDIKKLSIYIKKFWKISGYLAPLVDPP